jgi:SRSO17 transposase
MSDPFASDEAREAYKEALERAFQASRFLTDFLYGATKGGAAVDPYAYLLAAADEMKDAEAAWILFARLSEPQKDWEPVTLQ